MKSSAKYWLYALLISTSVLADTSVIAGERHALLVGVSNYLNHGVGLNNLPGAVNDIESLVPVLQEQWGFSAANITRLTDQQATRENILQTLAKLAQKLAPGDHLLFYFSGHGTGPLDTSKVAPLAHTTAALLPYDTAKIGRLTADSSSVLVGQRDIRPLFESLDQKGVYVTAIIDACYSEHATRTGFKLLPSRASSLTLDYSAGSFGTGSHAKDAYPYRNIITLSASAANQTAAELGNEAALRQFPTLDGEFHGAFSDVMLRALSTGSLPDYGPLDKNADGALTTQELYNGITRYMQIKGYEQTPKLQPTLSTQSKGRDLREQRLFFAADAPSPATPPAANSAAVSAGEDNAMELPVLKVKVSGDSTLQSRIGALAGIEINATSPDIMIDAGPAAYRMHIDGELIGQLASEDAVLELLRRRAALDQVLHKANHRPQATLALELQTEQSANYVTLGDFVKILMKSDQSGYPLVVDLFGNGDIFRLYPNRSAPSKRLDAHTTQQVFEVEVTEPLGMDSVYLFLLKEPVPQHILQTVWDVPSQHQAVFTSLLEWLNQPDSVLGASKLPVFIQAGKTELCRSQRHLNQARQHYEQALTLGAAAPESIDLLRESIAACGLFQNYFQLGYNLLAQQQLEDATEPALQAVQLAQNSENKTLGWWLLGRIKLERGQLPEAKSAFDAAFAAVTPGQAPPPELLEDATSLEQALLQRGTVSADFIGSVLNASRAVGVAPRIALRIEFDFDRADLQPAGTAQLQELAQALMHPVMQDYRITIVGHTDEKGDYDYNMKLSQRRATAVLAELVRSQPALKGKFQIQALGESQPRIPNAQDESQHALNRRVEFTLN